MWNVHDGRLTQEFTMLMPTSITSMILDGRQRKFILGDSTGNLRCFNCLNGAHMRNILLQPHAKAVSALAYSSIDRLLITSGWDRSVNVYQDTPPLDGENPYSLSRTLLRSIEDAHTSDITCLAMSRRLSLIATGDTSGWVKIWDLEFCQIDGIGLGHPTEVTCINFIDPHPCMLTGDADGNICIWGVRPFYPKYHVLFRGRIPRAALQVDREAELELMLQRLEKERKKKTAAAEKEESVRGNEEEKENKEDKEDEKDIKKPTEQSSDGSSSSSSSSSSSNPTFLTGEDEEENEKEEETFALTSMTRVYWRKKDVLPPPTINPYENEEGEIDSRHLIPKGDLSHLNHFDWKDKWRKENISGLRELKAADVVQFKEEVMAIEREEKMEKKEQQQPEQQEEEEEKEEEEEEECILIVCTTDEGQITIFDLLTYMPQSMLDHPLNEALLPPQLNSFNPLRRVARAGDDKAALERKMREVFSLFDVDDSGDIDVEELEEALGAMGHRFTQEECAALIAEADDDNSGVVEFEEFVALIALAQKKTNDREMELLQTMSGSSGTNDDEEGGGEVAAGSGGKKKKKKKKWTKAKSTGGGRGAVVVDVLNEWKGHQSAITALRVVDDPKRYIVVFALSCQLVLFLF